METIIVKPKSTEEAEEVLSVLKRMNVEAEILQHSSDAENTFRTKDEILDGIEQGAKEAAEFLQGKRELRSAKAFLNELRG